VWGEYIIGLSAVRNWHCVVHAHENFLLVAIGGLHFAITYVTATAVHIC
jgi:hypothetical protein